MRSLIVRAGFVAAATLTGAAHAHPTAWDADAPRHEVSGVWIGALLLVLALLFAVGWVRLHGRARSRAQHLHRRALSFYGGWLVVALALVSPLHEAGEHSFALHMVEHELIMLLGAPLLALAEPFGILLWALPSAARRRAGAALSAASMGGLWKWATRPATATIVQATALWLWHAPALFDLALADERWHITQHTTFLVSAVLFWSAMLERTGSRWTRANAGQAALCLFATSVVTGALGALMAFSASPWYAGYARLGLAAFGLTPAKDQQLAGLIMWIPGGLVHAAVALALVRHLVAPAQAVCR